MLLKSSHSNIYVHIRRYTSKEGSQHKLQIISFIHTLYTKQTANTCTHGDESPAFVCSVFGFF